MATGGLARCGITLAGTVLGGSPGLYGPVALRRGRFSRPAFSGHVPGMILALFFGYALAVRGQAPEAPASFSQRMVAESGFHGGLIVQVGLQDASLLLELGKAPNALVQGLVPDPNVLGRVRGAIRTAGVYGRVSARHWRGFPLPYTDGMVNILLVSVADVGFDASEVDRVLKPGGFAWIERNGLLEPYVKAWPDGVDEWSHSRYDATGNAVSRDKQVGPPTSLQWQAWPRWNHGTKTSSLVSSHGRIFYILDDSHFFSSARTWSLIARDAANGIRLWRHELDGWEGARGGKKVGPARAHRRLVASGERVYATLGESAPVSVLDAATGTVLRTLAETKPATEFILSDGVLIVVADPNTGAAARRGKRQDLRVMALDPEKGRLLWQHGSETVLPLTLASDGRRVVYHDGEVIRGFGLRDGKPGWVSSPTGQRIEHRDRAHPDHPGAEKGTIWLAPQFAPTLIFYNGVVAFAGGRQLNVLSAEDGRELWRSEYAPSNYSVPVDLFGFGGALWGPDPGMNMWRPLSDALEFNAFDPLTGEPAKQVSGSYGFRFQHHRCHQMKVVDGKVVAAKAGIEFLDTDTGDMFAHHWVRGSCFYGIMPANGLLYVPPHNCACYVRAKLSGFMALRSTPPARIAGPSLEERLQRGPAYETTDAGNGGEGLDDWPTYRHDMGRSGRTQTHVDSDLLLGWETELDGALTSPVIADKQVYVASRDAHRLFALDADSGEVVWEYGFDARVDSPPSVRDGRVVCGCRDGSVVALRAADGVPAWRFIARPRERVIVSRGQLESVWPVHGSVLVNDGVVYFAAGWSSYLDSGLRLYGLKLHTGEVVVERALWSRAADGTETMDEQSVDGYLNDILSSDGDRLFMRHQILDFQGQPIAARVTHLHSPDGFLSADTTSRLVWTYAPLYTSPHQGAFYDLRLIRVLFPSGRILVEGEDAIYGFGQNHYGKMRADPGGKWELFSAAKSSGTPLDLSAKEYRKLALSGRHAVTFNWHRRIPIQAWAMVKTADRLFVAGPRGYGTTSPEALAGRAGGVLLAVDPSDGRVLSEMSLPSMPAWDGMAAARGNLYIALANGHVVCLWSAASGRGGTPLSAAGWRATLPPVKVEKEPGLVGRWRMDEGGGMVARDCSGQGHDAEVTGRWAKGDFGSCVVAPGMPNAVLIPDAAHLQFGNDSFSLALWVKVDAYDVRLIGKEAFPKNWWVINLPPDGRAELVLGEGRGEGRSVRSKTASALATDAWTHLVAVVDRNDQEVRWYVNGALDSRTPIPGTMTDGLRADGRDIAIPSSHKPFRGLVGELRIYREALAPRRVKTLHDEQASRRRSIEFTVPE